MYVYIIFIAQLVVWLPIYLHADYVRDYLPSGIKYRAFSDAGLVSHTYIAIYM